MDKTCWKIEPNVNEKQAVIRMFAATGLILLLLFGSLPGWLGVLLAFVIVGLMVSAVWKRCHVTHWYKNRAAS